MIALAHLVVPVAMEVLAATEAQVVSVQYAAADRVQPPCAHFGVCGGCSLQHMAPPAQIAFKQSVLADHLRHFGGLSPETWLAPLTHDASVGYRRKARLGVRYVIKKEKLLVGRFYTVGWECGGGGGADGAEGGV